MSKLQECIDTYEAEFKKIDVKFDSDLLRAVTKGCGPSIYKADSAKVAASDKAEMDRVKQNFLIKKLGLDDDEKLDKGLEAVVEKIGKSNRNKYRAMVYYLLVKHFKKEDVYAS